MIKESLRKASIAWIRIAKERRVQKTCPVCSKRFSVPPSLARQKTCSFSCARKLNWRDPNYKNQMSEAHKGKISWRKGKKHKNESILKMRQAHFGRQDKYVHSSGYVFVYKPEHPRAVNGRVPEQILIAEKALGRFLKPEETVHHINLIKSDNRKSNLVICTQKYHKQLHSRMRKFGILIKPNGIQRDSKTGRFLPQNPDQVRPS